MSANCFRFWGTKIWGLRPHTPYRGFAPRRGGLKTFSKELSKGRRPGTSVRQTPGQGYTHQTKILGAATPCNFALAALTRTGRL